MAHLDPHDMQRLMGRATEAIDALESISASLETLAEKAETDLVFEKYKAGFICTNHARAHIFKTGPHTCYAVDCAEYKKEDVL